VYLNLRQRAVALAIAFSAVFSATGCVGPAIDATPEGTVEAYLDALAQGRLADALLLTHPEARPTDPSTAVNRDAPEGGLSNVNIDEVSPDLNGVRVYVTYSLNGMPQSGDLLVVPVTLEGESRWRIGTYLPSLDLSFAATLGTPVINGERVLEQGIYYVAPGKYTLTVEPFTEILEYAGTLEINVGLDDRVEPQPLLPTLTSVAKEEVLNGVRELLAPCEVACSRVDGAFVLYDLAFFDPGVAESESERPIRVGASTDEELLRAITIEGFAPPGRIRLEVGKIEEFAAPCLQKQYLIDCGPQPLTADYWSPVGEVDLYFDISDGAVELPGYFLE
jgi:hypothetical protein